jgi:hypothetical protein
MDMHRFRGMAMDPGFSLGQQQKNLPHLLRQGRGQGCRHQQIAQLAPRAMVGILFEAMNLKVQAPQARAAPFLYLQAIAPSQAEIRQGSVDDGFRNAEIQQGRQQHVARQASGGVNV